MMKLCADDNLTVRGIYEDIIYLYKVLRIRLKLYGITPTLKEVKEEPFCILLKARK